MVRSGLFHFRLFHFRLLLFDFCFLLLFTVLTFDLAFRFTPLFRLVSVSVLVLRFGFGFGFVSL